VEQFIEARKSVREYGLQRLKRELVAPGYVDRLKGQLTTTKKPFNIFALIGTDGWALRTDVERDASNRANANLEAADPEYAKRFKVAFNMPQNDANWENEDWVGKASMSKYHRFLIIRQPGANETPNMHRMDYTWTWFNVVTMGMRDVDPKGSLMDPDDIAKLEANTEKNIEALKAAVHCLKYMRDVALSFVKHDFETGWSDNVKLYFHCYPHCSVNSLHLHIVDVKYAGPTYTYCAFKNLEMDFVIEAYEREIKDATVLVPTDANT